MHYRLVKLRNKHNLELWIPPTFASQVLVQFFYIKKNFSGLVKFLLFKNEGLSPALETRAGIKVCNLGLGKWRPIAAWGCV